MLVKSNAVEIWNFFYLEIIFYNESNCPSKSSLELIAKNWSRRPESDVGDILNSLTVKYSQ